MQPTTTMRPPGPHSTTMDDKTTATLTDVAATKEVSSATTEIPSKTEVPSASTEAPSTTMASSPGPTSLSFVDCVAAVSSTDKSGIDAISALPGKLQQNCPELAKILESSAVRTKLDTYARQDAEAVRQQTQLVEEATRANACLAAVGLTSGVILAVSALSADSSPIQYLTLALGVVTLLLGAAAAFFTYVARDQGRVSRWQTCRGEAEIDRLAVFGTVAAKAADKGADVALAGLALVSVHLLDDQRKWLGARASRHRSSSETTSRLGGIASSLAFIGGSGAIIASQKASAVWIVLAGVVGAAVGAYASNRDALRRDRANAERYENTEVALNGVAGRIDDVAEQIVAGEPKALVAFTETLCDLLSTEHKQWLEGTAQAAASLEKLDAQLKEQLSKSQKQTPGTPRTPGTPGESDQPSNPQDSNRQ
jgi:hypothetical protein